MRRFNPGIRLVIAFLVYEVLTIGVAGLLSVIPGLPTSETVNNVLRLIMFILYVTAFYLLQKSVDRSPYSLLGLKVDANAAKSFLLAFALTGVLIFAGALLSNALFGAELSAPTPRTWADLGSGFMAAFVLQGFPEEMAFRGYMPQTMEKSPIPTMIVTSLFFMMLHWHFVFSYMPPYLFMELGYAFAFGFLAFVLRYLFRTTWSAVAVHGGIHIFRTITEILGMSDGSHRSLVNTILMMIVALILIFMNREAFLPKNNRIPH